MTKFCCDNYKPIYQGQEFGHIIVENAQDAARVFANRYARKRYGKRGAVGPVNVDCWAANGRYVNISAFVGYSARDGGITGSNHLFTVFIYSKLESTK